MIPKLYLYLRALSNCPYYYKLWHEYLTYKLNALIEEPLYQDMYCIEIDFEMCLLFVNQFPKIYKLYLQFLIEYMPYKPLKIISTLNKALIALPYPLHKQLWSIILPLVDKLNNKLGAMLLKRYYYTLNEKIEKQNLILKLFVMDLETAISFFSSEIPQLDPVFVESILCEYCVDLVDDLDVLELLKQFNAISPSFRVINAIASVYISQDNFDMAVATLENGISSINSIYDVCFIYEHYLSLLQFSISNLLESNNDIAELVMDKLDYLHSRHLFILHSTLVKQFPNSITIWRNYIQMQKMLKKPLKIAYQLALKTIDPKRAVPLNELPNFFKEYATDCGQDVYEEATQYKFNSKELESMFMLKAQHFYSDIEKARSIYHQGLSEGCGTLLFKQWIDFEEQLDDHEHIISVYELAIKHKKITPLLMMQYIVYLHDMEMYEAMFSIYERGIQLFPPFQVQFYKSYLPLLVKVNSNKIERLRHVFDQCITNACTVQFIEWYAHVEAEFGMISKSSDIWKTGAQKVNLKDKRYLYELYISTSKQYDSKDACRRAYETAIQDMQDDDTRAIALEFIEFELENGEIDRARELYGWTSQFCHPILNKQFWDDWQSFEVKYGNEETFKEYLRNKKIATDLYNTEVQYLKANLTLETPQTEINSGLDKLRNKALAFVKTQ